MPAVRTDDGVSISYKALGAGPLHLLFLHGWGGSGGYWDGMLKYFDLNGLYAITPSYRGHGDSDKPTTGYTLERFAKDMFAVANDANADRFVLVGFSMSGKYAQYMTLMEPDRVLGEVLIAPCGAGELAFPEEMARSWCDAVGNRHRIKELLTPFYALPAKPELMDAFLDDFVKIPRVALEQTIHMFAKTSFIEKVKAIRAPTLVIAGVDDPVLTPEYMRQNLIAQIPGSRLVVLPCGHEIPHEMPSETAALLSAFVAGLR